MILLRFCTLLIEGEIIHVSKLKITKPSYCASVMTSNQFHLLASRLIVSFGLVIPLIFSYINDVIGNALSATFRSLQCVDYISISFRSLHCVLRCQGTVKFDIFVRGR